MNGLLLSTLPQPERDWAAPWAKKIPGCAAILTARSLGHVPRAPARAVPGDILIGFNNLGDQIRMLNVLSRYDYKSDSLASNVEARAALSLYGLHASRTYSRHGVGALPDIVSGLCTGRERFSRALVPHPAVTQPLALGLARALADRAQAAITGEYRCGAAQATFFTCDRSSWRGFYESFFTRVLGTSPIAEKPRVSADFQRCGQESTSVVVHLTSTAAERAMPHESILDVLAAIRAKALAPLLVGAESERSMLEPIARMAGCHSRIGEPLVEVARELAQAKCFVGVDSSIMNLADAIGVPSVVLYNATEPAVVGPFYVHLEPVQIRPPTVRDVSILTGRIEQHQADWSGAGSLVGRALDRLFKR